MHAYPVEGIVIDGDLSDWPTDVIPVSVENDLYDRPPTDADDFTATLRVGYSPEDDALYVALEVRDEAHRVGELMSGWDGQDTCVLYVDPTHSQLLSGGAGYVASGNYRGITGREGTWDPRVTEASLDDVEIAVHREDGRTVYEYLVLLREGEARPGRTLGFDVAVIDADPEDTDRVTWVSWGPFGSKSNRASRLGDLLLLEEDAQFGRLRGTSRWAADVENDPGYLGRVQITSDERPGLWFQVTANTDGDYEIDLPPGSYTITCPFPAWGESLGPHFLVRRDVQARATVRAGETTSAETLVLRTKTPPPLMQERGVLLDWGEGRGPEVDAFLEAYRDYFEIPGLSVALVKGGKIVYHRVLGVKNAFTREPVTEDTLFEACSMTKTVLAFLVLRMVERDELDLDRPLHQYLPYPDAAHDDRYRKITARHVLSHRTGWPNWRRYLDSGRLDLAFEPGTDFGYSGEGIEYLGMVVAHLRGRKLEDLLREEVLGVMGFERNTHFANNPELARVVAHGHDTQRPWVAIPPSEIGVAHSMHTEARSFANFLLGLLARKGLADETYEAMLRFESVQEPLISTWGVPWKRGFGLGFAVRDTPFGKAFGHGGSNGDFHCLFELYPEQDLGFVAFGNNERAWAFAEALRRFLIAGGTVPPVN